MIIEAVNTIMGLGICAIAKSCNPGWKLPDIWTEFAGDGAQGIISQIIKGIQKRRENKKLGSIFAEILDADIEEYKKIFDEIRENKKSIDENKKVTFWEKMKDSCGRAKEKIQKLLGISGGKNKSALGSDIVSISNEILWGFDYKTYLLEYSPNNFAKLFDEGQQQLFIDRLKFVIDIYRKDVFVKTEEPLQVVAGIIVNSLEDYIEKNNETIIRRIEAMLSRVAVADGGVNLERIEIASYPLKYILNQCPECGYCGDRLYINEHNSTTYCAACGKSYSIVKYCEPELWQEIQNRLKGMESSLENIGDEVKNIGELLQGGKTELETLRAGVAQIVTKQYLDDLLKGENGLIANQSANMKNLLDNAFKEYNELIGNRISDLCDEQRKFITANIESVVIEINKSIEDGNLKLSNNIISMNNDLLDFRDNAYNKFSEQGKKLDDILDIMQKLYESGFHNKLRNSGVSIQDELIESVIKNKNQDKVKTIISEFNNDLSKLDKGIKELLKNQVIKIPKEFKSYDESTDDIICPYCGIKGEKEEKENGLYFYCKVCKNKFLNIKPDCIKSKLTDIKNWIQEKEIKVPLADESTIKEWENTHSNNYEIVNEITYADDILVLPKGDYSNKYFSSYSKQKIKTIIIGNGCSNIKFSDFFYDMCGLEKIIFKGNIIYNNSIKTNSDSDVHIYSGGKFVTKQ